jgi:hypothetical protein
MKARWVTCLAAALIVVVGCTTSAESGNGAGGKTSARCEEPENPYSEGSGHYAGYAWAEEHASAACDGSSQSFNEGCEEHQTQEAEYDECENAK